MPNDFIALARIDFAVPSDSGEAVIFAFMGHDGKQYKFGCPPPAIPEIIARLLGAAARCATAQQVPQQGILVLKTMVTAHEKQKTVGLSLFPTEQTGIPFVLTAELAQKLSSGLAHASATVDPTPIQTTH